MPREVDIDLDAVETHAAWRRDRMRVVEACGSKVPPDVDDVRLEAYYDSAIDHLLREKPRGRA